MAHGFAACSSYPHAETGLDYMFARYYGSSVSRFLSADPESGDLSSPQSLNRYTYAMNNPIVFVDPDGQAVRYANASIRQVVETLVRQSADIRGIVEAHQGDSAPDLDFDSGSLGKDPVDGSEIRGEAISTFKIGYALTTDASGNPALDESKVASADYTGTKITLDTKKAKTLEAQQKVLTEEINHAGDAKANPVLAAQEKVSQSDSNVPHDKRPGEQRVKPMNANVEKQRREHKKKQPKEHKEDQKTPPAQ